MQLDELINQFFGLSESIAEAIVSDLALEHIRQLDDQLMDIFDTILLHNTTDSQESLKKSHFLLDQIVCSEDLGRRKHLAEHLKEHCLSLPK